MILDKYKQYKNIFQSLIYKKGNLALKCTFLGLLCAYVATLINNVTLIWTDVRDFQGQNSGVEVPDKHL